VTDASAPMSAWDALRARRSAKTFADRIPPREVLERLIEAATWAPNHRLTEPWRFVVLAGDERARFGAHLAAAMAEAGEPAKAVEKTRAKPLRSPVLVVIAQRGPAANAEVEREDYAAVATATQNLLIAATAEGLATKWSTGGMAEMPEARAFLGLGGHDRIVAYVYLGYPAGDASSWPEAPPTRKPPEVDWRGL